MKTSIKRYLLDFSGLIYPQLCLACGKRLPNYQDSICISCQVELPKTNFHKDKENPFTEKFAGRIELVSGAALYFFKKGGLTQKLIHNFKYKGQSFIGIYLGRLLGEQLKFSPHFESVDAIIPVPLHPKKKKKRGFNQSEEFAKGLSEILRRPVLVDVLKRKTFTATQTKKDKFERVENVMEVFKMVKPEKVKGKHILIVDDVLTTGSTLEACAVRILEVPDTKVSLATIAMTVH